MNDVEEVDNKWVPPQLQQFVTFAIRMLLPLAVATVKALNGDLPNELG